jgi:hypothetical protein
MLVRLPRLADGVVQVRPRLRLVLGLEQMADGAEAAGKPCWEVDGPGLRPIMR